MIAGELLQKGLQIIGFHINESKNPSVVFVSELFNTNQNLSPYQIIELEKASYFKADAVFFRYFEDGRPPIAQIYIYDNSNGNLSVEYAQIHKELWSNCHIPTYIIIEKTKVKFFDCRKPVSIDSKGNIYTRETDLIDLEDIAKYADVIKKYNAEKFINGSFWESKVTEKNYLYDKTAYTNLIDKLKTLRKKYNKNSNISQSLFDYVIIISTLIKFLEENGIDANGENLASRFFQNEVKCGSFIEILEKNRLIYIIESLSRKFNGGIFDLTKEDKQQLSQANLTPIINFFDTKLDSKNQFVLWDLYSFKHIPVELISNIYEEFLPLEDKGAVYTPNYLVNFLIDECLPIPSRKELNQSVVGYKKTIDVSCGSGIFLVNSFKRLVDIYKINEFYKNNSFPQKIGTKELQKILNDNIFGVDVNKNAVELTKFSLQLALCQMLSPQQIWTELTFQDLGEKNILQQDFFDFVTNLKTHNKFDLVIGNPPFNPPPKDNGSKYKNSEYFNEVVEKYKIIAYPIKDHNLALLFLQLSTNLLKQNTGLLCLIQPALPLLHKKENQSFREKLFKEKNVLQVIDFTTLRRVLFPSATVPTCAIFIQNTEKRKEDITHIVIRRTKPSKERLYFEIDTYDIHSVNQKDARNNYAWKSNLFGGYRLYNLIQRINKNKELKKLENIIESEESKLITNYSLLKIVENNYFPKFSNSQKTIKYFSENYSFLVAYIAGKSTRQGIDRPYDVLKSDFLNLPIIKDKSALTIADKILAEDIAKYKVTEFGQGENAVTNKEIQVKKEILPIAIKEFANTYLDALNSIYSIDNKKISLIEVFNTPACFILCFEYGKQSNQLEKITNRDNVNLIPLVKDNTTETIIIKRITIIYSQNKIFIIKPKQLRYWLKSTALLDADTTIADIINLNLLK